MSESLRSRSERTVIRQSPFYRLCRTAPVDLLPLLVGCRDELARIHGQLEEHGVSVDVVYSLDAIDRGLLRIERLLPLATHSATGPTELHKLLRVLARGLIG